jgi:hypothetical protein
MTSSDTAQTPKCPRTNNGPLGIKGGEIVANAQTNRL